MSAAHESPAHVRSQLMPFDDPEPGSTWLVSLASIILLVVLVILVSVVFFRADHHEVTVKVVDAGQGQVPPAPSQPLDAKSFDALQRDLRGKLDEGIITNAQFSQASQRLELATYMKFSWPDAKGVPQPRLRIPVTRAMEAMVAESGPKGADAGKGGGAK